jgi:hypothetical protein
MVHTIAAGKILRSAQNDTCGVVILMNEVKDLLLKLSHYSKTGVARFGATGARL